MTAKRTILTYTGLRALEAELEELKVVRRKEVAQKIKEAREQGDLSENAEYDAAKDEQRDIEARIEEIEKIHGSDNWELATILQEEGNCYLYEKLGYKRSGTITKINDRMDIVGYEK